MNSEADGATDSCRIASAEYDLRALSSSNDDEAAQSCRARLLLLTVPEIKTVAKNIGVRLTGAARKVEMVARLLGMASIGAMKRIIDDGDG